MPEGMSDYAYAIALRGEIEKITMDALDRTRPKYQYATVNSINRPKRKAMVTFVGESLPVEVNIGGVQPMVEGQRVRIAGLQGDRYLDDVIGPVSIDAPRNLLSMRAQKMLMNTAGKKDVTDNCVWWKEHFQFIGTGSTKDTGTAKYFNITMPPVGTFISRYTNAFSQSDVPDSAVTVTSEGIPLAAYDSLWYIPTYTNSYDSDPSRFRVWAWNTPSQVPADWVFIAYRLSAAAGNRTVHWCDDTYMDSVHPFSFGNGFGVWSDPLYQPCGYYRLNSTQEIQLTGVVTGTSQAGGVTMAQLPTEARPTKGYIFQVPTSAGIRGLRVYNDGAVRFEQTFPVNEFAALDSVRFRLGRD